MATILTPAQIVATLSAAVSSGQDDETRINQTLIALVNLSQSLAAMVTPTSTTTSLQDANTFVISQNGVLVSYSASDLALRFQMLLLWLDELGFDLPEELLQDNVLLNAST